MFLTDYFDGIIARTQNRETLFGKYIDPFADKLLTISLIYYLYSQNIIFWQKLIVPILIPEILLIILGIIYTFTVGILVPRPIVWGRIKFSFYFFAIVAFLLMNYSIAHVLFLFLIGVAFGFLSIISYAKRVFNEVNLKFFVSPKQ